MTEHRAHPKASAAADKPMVIVSTSYDADVVTVAWQAVNYASCDGFVISIGKVGTQLDNYQIDDPKATSDEADFTCQPNVAYEVLVAPIIRGTPKNSLTSPRVPIPYSALTSKRG